MSDSVPFADEIEDNAVTQEAQTSWGMVFLDGLAIPVLGDVGVTNLATMQSRVTFGDYSLASDQFLSVWVMSDWTGGGQVEDLREASHAQRYRHATAEATHPRMLTQPLETTSYTLEPMPDEATPIGDYDDDDDGVSTMWGAFDTNLCSWDAADEEWDIEDTLTAFPAGAMKGVVFDGLLWIPQGASGYDTWDGSNVVHSNEITPIEFVEWDDKLVALEHDGQVSVHQSGSTGWDVRSELKLKGGRKARHLVVWWSQDGFPTMYVVTSKEVWAVSWLDMKLIRTGLMFPAHPDHGLAATSWRDDAMYVSVGVGAHQLSRGNVISAMGLDRDDGLPASLRGRIVDVEGEYNGLLALVEGLGSVTIGSDDTLGPEIEETAIRDDAMIVPEASRQARSTLQKWTGVGWHTLWESGAADGVPTRVVVSEADDDYTLWWAYAGRMYKQPLRRTFYNPRQGAQLGIDRFALSSNLLTGRFDANLQAFRKLASHVEVHLDPDSTGEVDVYYQTDRATWTLLGTVSGTGMQILKFDPNGDGWYEGEAWQWIEFEYRLRNTDASQTVIVNYIILSFLVLPLQTRSWTLSVPLDFGQWEGRGPREIADQLDALAIGEEFVSFKHRDRTYRVKLAQTRGSEKLGHDFQGARSVTLLEVIPASEAV